MPKPTKNTVINLRLGEDLARDLKKRAGGNISRYIRELIERDIYGHKQNTSR